MISSLTPLAETLALLALNTALPGYRDACEYVNEEETISKHVATLDFWQTLISHVDRRREERAASRPNEEVQEREFRLAEATVLDCFRELMEEGHHHIDHPTLAGYLDGCIKHDEAAFGVTEI